MEVLIERAQAGTLRTLQPHGSGQVPGGAGAGGSGTGAVAETPGSPVGPSGPSGVGRPGERAEGRPGAADGWRRAHDTQGRMVWIGMDMTFCGTMYAVSSTCLLYPTGMPAHPMRLPSLDFRASEGGFGSMSMSPGAAARAGVGHGDHTVLLDPSLVAELEQEFANLDANGDGKKPSMHNKQAMYSISHCAAESGGDAGPQGRTASLGLASRVRSSVIGQHICRSMPATPTVCVAG